MVQDRSLTVAARITRKSRCDAALVRDAFAPTKEELEKAIRIVEAFEAAEKQGLGVVSLGRKMIGPPS